MSSEMQMIEKFSDPFKTAKGEERASVNLMALKTLWFNTGTLCNLSCKNCYIKSTPKNDDLVYLTYDEVYFYLDEIKREDYPTTEIGITGGEPFMNPDIIPIMKEILERGFNLLVLTNAMRPMEKCAEQLLLLNEEYGEQMTLRISVDHFKRELHEEERGPRSWEPAIKGLKWLCDNGFKIDIAGRTRWGENESELRDGFAALFRELDIKIDAHNKEHLVLFPEMDEMEQVPEITTACWGILGVKPDDMMCSSSRMIVKRKGAIKPAVLACTLLADDLEFELGNTLKEAHKTVHLNHPHCAKFCVLGGGECSGKNAAA